MRACGLTLTPGGFWVLCSCISLNVRALIWTNLSIFLNVEAGAEYHVEIIWFSNFYEISSITRKQSTNNLITQSKHARITMFSLPWGPLISVQIPRAGMFPLFGTVFPKILNEIHPRTWFTELHKCYTQLLINISLSNIFCDSQQ